MTAHTNHPWLLSGPWYRWSAPGLPSAGRVSAPALQKFAGDDFIQAFMARPQASLKFDPVSDVVHQHDLVSMSRFSPLGRWLLLNRDGQPASAAEQANGQAFKARLAPTGLRKLYQPTHDRHYVVSCELHCDVPGLPSVTRQQVCQAGFVVRRRTSVQPAGADVNAIDEALKAVRAAEADWHELVHLARAGDEAAPGSDLRRNVLRRQQALVQAASPAVASWEALLSRSLATVDEARAALQAVQTREGVRVQIEGWFPQVVNGRPSPTFGEWRALNDDAQQADPCGVIGASAVPTTTTEQVYPLFALVADPRDTQHDAAGRTMYYGVVPTASLQHDLQGQARFHDQATYEVRCFVRRHSPCQARVGKQPDCFGAVTWSRPTEAFRVAAPFDVLGSANRPITIKLPDLRELAAQAAMRPKGRLSPVRMVQPQHLSPNTDGSGLSGGTMGGEAICSFSIPLITLVALFVLNLFLPIVVFVFQLWFLLVFRFCIPPSVQANLTLDAALAATPPGVDLEADFQVEVAGVDTLVKATDLAAHLMGNGGIGQMELRIRQSAGLNTTPSLEGRDNQTLGSIDQSFQDHAALPSSLTPVSSGGAAALPPVGERLETEPPVVPVWPVGLTKGSTPQGASA
ncbi:hypothetical protein WNB94_08460 [Aquabacterium sp. A3]|uniref:hypothetical protein n=1 Tax=Aquabacterium sp. A3 TaxID=3132829 RepID=UPI003119A1BA